MTVIKARLDKVVAFAEPTTSIKPIQRGVVGVNSGHNANVIIAPVNPSKSYIRLSYRNNIGSISSAGSASFAAAAEFTGTADFIITDGVSNAFNLRITEPKLVAQIWGSDSYTYFYLTAALQLHWELIEHV